MKGIYDCEIMQHIQIGEKAFELLLKCPEIADEAAPGQFVTVRVSPTLDPLLRRPFSIHSVNRDAGHISLMYLNVGRGTRLLTTARASDSLNIVGPLGTGFDMGNTTESNHILVAGGCGAAPLAFLCSELCAKWGAHKVRVLLGARTAGAVVCKQDYDACEAAVEIATDDGTQGYSGLVTDLLPHHLNSSSLSSRVYCCGPEPMLLAVSSICVANGVSCQVSLENNMACGMGICMGCVQKIRNGNLWDYKRVCADGPVFNAEDVIWQ